MEVEEPDVSHPDSSYNGLMLRSRFLPEEVLIHLLSFVDPRSLVFQCRYVCRLWRDLLSTTEVWKLKMQHSNIKSLSKYDSNERKKLTAGYPWYLYYWVLNDVVPFEKNLLLNNCGQENFEHWRVIEPLRASLDEAYWAVETQPVYANPLPKSDDFENNTSCFSTSYVRCMKTQTIDLRGTNRFPKKLLDEFQPTIKISEWYTGRFDCACEYAIQIYLLDEMNQTILATPLIEKPRAQWQNPIWEKVKFKINYYGPGLRYIRFEHYGKDRQYWKGNYGSKMAGGVVKLSFPKIQGKEDAKTIPEIYVIS